ncbi:MAG TPA: acyl-CoA dehydrogenase N-terminal domain-containing protein, partial [Pseudomonadales bacterium]|nr:acyl-CoA dehydrogenase N-terminal domain-containing protein [Pseudomonadales bacterium]
MTSYSAPVRDIMFVLEKLVDIESLCRLPRFSEADTAMIESILEEAGKFAVGELAPLNSVGDHIGAKLVSRQVRETSGFADAYRKFIGGGWTSIACNPDYGGMGLPECVGAATMEMWSAANVSFALCPMLGQGAIEALESHAAQSLKDIYLGRLVSGEW